MVDFAGRAALFAGRIGEHFLRGPQVQRVRGGVRDRCPDHPAGRTAAATGLGVAGAGRVDGSHGGDAGGKLCPRRPQRKLYPAAGKGRDHRQGDRLLHPGNIRQPADPVRRRDPHRKAECRRCDRLGWGKKSGLEPDLPQRGRRKPLDHLENGGRLFADAVHRPAKRAAPCGMCSGAPARGTTSASVPFPAGCGEHTAPETSPQRVSAG